MASDERISRVRVRWQMKTVPKRPGVTTKPRPAPKVAKRNHRWSTMIDDEGKRLVCVHCKEKLANRPRGLCWGCYYTPGVKALYPSTSKYARRGVGNLTGEIPLADEPTLAQPGSEEKILVMQHRALTGRAIFHPHDVTIKVGASLKTNREIYKDPFLEQARMATARNRVLNRPSGKRSDD